MMTIAALLGGMGGYVVAGVAVVITLVGGWLTAVQSGKNKAAASTARQTVKDMTDALHADAQVDGLDGAARRDELLKKYSRN